MVNEARKMTAFLADQTPSATVSNPLIALVPFIFFLRE
jgi:hypothetical protein